MNRFTLLTAAVVAVGGSACGGDGSSTPDPMTPPEATNQVPASALVSTEAFTRYAASLAPSETAEPLDVSAVVPPVSETEEPRTL